MTMDRLALMVGRGFNEVYGRMSKGFDEAAKKKEVDVKFEQVDRRFDHVDATLEHMDARLFQVEKDVAEIKRHFVYRDEFDDLMSRVKYLEEKLGIDSGKD